MKRIFSTFPALVLALALLLSACGQKAAEPKQENAQSAQETQNEGETKETPPAQPEETPVEVENNGGHYVRVNDRVYFRRYGADALEKAAVFGEFTTAWNVCGASELMALDTKTGALETAFAEAGCGPLWYGDGGFYLTESYDNEDAAFWYAPDGSSCERLCAGSLLGVTDSGLVAVERLEGTELAYSFYRDKKEVGTYRSQENFTFVGLTDDGAFLLSVDYDNDEGTTSSVLVQIAPDGKRVDLGKLPPVQSEGFYGVQADRFAASGDKVVVGVGYYAGTGHFLSEEAFVEATVGKQNSTRELDVNVETADNALPRLAVGEDGTITPVAALENELRVDYETGALLRYENGAWKDFPSSGASGPVVLCPPAPTDGLGYHRFVQELDYVDGRAYVTMALCHDSPVDSIGWRDAFALLDMAYRCVEPDGTGRELTDVDYGAELYGEVWFIEGESTALWRQLQPDDDIDYLPGFAYRIPISEDAYWEGGREAVFDGVTGLLSPDAIGEPDYYGYDLPSDPPAGKLCLTLDREGRVVALARKGPADLLAIDFDVDDDALRGAKAKLDHEWDGYEEDTPFFWAKLRVLEDGVRVRVERVKKNMNDVEAYASIEGLFPVGELVYDGVLDRGEFLALRASMPWHSELRVSVSKDGAWGSYIFGEDNWMHLETEESIHPELLLAAKPMPSIMDYTEGEPRRELLGTWLCRAPETGEVRAMLRLDEDGTMFVSTVEADCLLRWSLDRLYAEEYQTPDILSVQTEQPVDVGMFAFDGSAGDYRIEYSCTDGEEILYLSQANNGDGVLSYLLAGGATEFSFVFTRARGTGDGVLPRRSETFPAAVVRYDAEAGVLWLRDAEAVDSYEDGRPVWRANPYRSCAAYPFGGAEAKAYPYGYYEVTVDKDGAITSIKPLND